MLNFHKNIAKDDPELWKIIYKEKIRQEQHIELIASENYVSKNVMEVMGTLLTNKYAEGYPNNRYYGGCEWVDFIEQLAIDRAKVLFGADYVNVQPHSGSQANFSVYLALLSPGNTVMGLSVSHGGHLTHGSPVNFSGKLYNFIQYKTDINGNINYNDILILAKKFKPKMIVGGFSAYSGKIDWSLMREIADSVDAYLLVDMAHVAGLVISGIYPDPLPHAHVVTTTTHKTLAGPRGGLILAKGGNTKFYKKLNNSVFPGTQGGPLMHVIASKAVAFKEAMKPSFKIYQNNTVKNAKIMSKVFLSRNFNIISGKTDNHLFLIDLRNQNISGKYAEEALSKANIIVNKNCIPNDQESPLITSGIRIGTPAITRRGLNKFEVYKLAMWICDIIENINNELIIDSIKTKVLAICSKYPVYQ